MTASPVSPFFAWFQYDNERRRSMNCSGPAWVRGQEKVVGLRRMSEKKPAEAGSNKVFGRLGAPTRRVRFS